MTPKKIWANLGIKDVARTIDFYTRLGFAPNKRHDKNKELTSFLFGDHDFVINFFLKDVLKDSLRGELANLALGNEVMFTLWAESREAADTWAEEVRKAGGTIFSEPETFGEGYYGFGFSDPDGHKWNVFHI
jgi:predicted lactoylglutathione lyase